MCSTLIVPGLNGSGEGHWQRHWAREREDARVVEQENWSCPVLGDWQANLEEALSHTESAFLVAHSLGCILTASMAGRPAAEKIAGALLVAPCDLDAVERLHPCVLNFGPPPLARLPFPTLVVGSLNDPYMDVGQLRHYAARWGSDLVNIGAAGHINIASGHGRWEEGYRLFERLQNPAWQRARRTPGADRKPFAESLTV